MNKIEPLEPDATIGKKKVISDYAKKLKMDEFIDWQHEMVDYFIKFDLAISGLTQLYQELECKVDNLMASPTVKPQRS